MTRPRLQRTATAQPEKIQFPIAEQNLTNFDTDVLIDPHGCGHLRPRPLLCGTAECPSGVLLALVGGGGLREGGQRQR